MTRALALLLLLAAPGCGASPRQDLGRMRELSGAAHAFHVGHLAIAARTDERTASRIQRYAAGLLERVGPLFGPPAGPVRVFVFDTKEAVAEHASAICAEPRPPEPSMGYYHAPSRSVLCSMQWGLGWLGDLILRSSLEDDWRGLPRPPAPWFRPSFVSMLYNSFRTPRGDFEGLNVMSYYRPQVQRMLADGAALPLDRFLRGDYDESKLEEDAIRKQGREFLAWLHAQGLLTDFYRRFRDGCAVDPTGVAAVESLLGKPLDRVEAEWRAWITAADGEIGASAMARPFPVLGVLVERESAGDGIVLFLACPGSPAARAGLKRGDRIVRLNASPVGSLDDLVRVLGGLAIDSVVVVRLADGREVRVTLDRFIDG